MSKIWAVAFTAMTSLVMTSCTGWQPRYKASYFYTDPKFLEMCKAIKRNDAEEVKAVLLRGVDINARGTDDMTLLCWTVYQRKKEMFKFLLEEGADPNIRMTLRSGASTTILELLILVGWPDYVDTLLRFSPSVNVNIPEHYYGNTPLFDAIKYDSSIIIKQLLAHGADIEWKNNMGWTPLIESIVMANFRAAILLIESGADVDVVSNSGRTVVDFLEKSSAGPNAKYYKWKLKLADVLIRNGYHVDMEVIKKGFSIDMKNDAPKERSARSAGPRGSVLQFDFIRFSAYC